MEVGLKISATLPFTMIDKVLMMMGDMDIGLIPYTLPIIIRAGLLYFGGFYLCS